jgi:hypothetical protein
MCIAGGAADQLSIGHGTQAVALKSQNVALSGAENIDFDVAAGRRRRLRSSHQGRRAHRRQ